MIRNCRPFWQNVSRNDCTVWLSSWVHQSSCKTARKIARSVKRVNRNRNRHRGGGRGGGGDGGGGQNLNRGRVAGLCLRSDGQTMPMGQVFVRDIDGLR